MDKKKRDNDLLRQKVMHITPEIEHQGNISWAQVELFRWEYGCLPGPDDMREIHPEKAFKMDHLPW